MAIWENCEVKGCWRWVTFLCEYNNYTVRTCWKHHENADNIIKDRIQKDHEEKIAILNHFEKVMEN